MKTWKKCCIVTLCSLFLQLLHWLIYQFAAIPAGFLAVTPLLLCAVYHLYQSDSLENRGILRRQVFGFGVLLPLLLAVFLSLAMYLHNPDLALYHSGGDLTGSAAEVAALYAGRVALTSLYLLVFSALDVFLLRLQDHRREKAGGAVS